MPYEERNQGKAGDFSSMVPEETNSLRMLVNMMKHVAEPDRSDLDADEGNGITENNVDHKGDHPLPGLGQRNQGPGFHAPYIGGQKENDDHPFPPSKDPVNMADTGNTLPPGEIEAKGISNAFAKHKPPEGHNENGVKNQCQHGTPADFGKPGPEIGRAHV